MRDTQLEPGPIVVQELKVEANNLGFSSHESESAQALLVEGLAIPHLGPGIQDRAADVLEHPNAGNHMGGRLGQALVQDLNAISHVVENRQLDCPDHSGYPLAERKVVEEVLVADLVFREDGAKRINGWNSGDNIGLNKAFDDERFTASLFVSNLLLRVRNSIRLASQVVNSDSTYEGYNRGDPRCYISPRNLRRAEGDSHA
mgnify:CR=1 FL=1